MSSNESVFALTKPLTLNVDNLRHVSMMSKLDLEGGYAKLVILIRTRKEEPRDSQSNGFKLQPHHHFPLPRGLWGNLVVALDSTTIRARKPDSQAMENQGPAVPEAPNRDLPPNPALLVD